MQTQTYLRNSNPVPLDLLRDSELDLAENEFCDLFASKMDELKRDKVILKNPRDKTFAVHSAVEKSRYHPKGQRRIKKRIHQRLGHFPYCGGVLIDLTVADPDREEDVYRGKHRLLAWQDSGSGWRYFMDRVNKYRKAHGLSKVKRYIRVVEDQPGREFPCPHIWFPNLKHLAPIEVLQRLWPYGNVDLQYRDSESPATYIIKYLTKMEGKGFMQAMIWYFHLRMFSTSRDYKYSPDHSAPSPWRFHCSLHQSAVQGAVDMLTHEGYSHLRAGPASAWHSAAHGPPGPPC